MITYCLLQIFEALLNLEEIKGDSTAQLKSLLIARDAQDSLC